MPESTKKRITLKVSLGYLLLTVFTAASIYIIYTQVVELNQAGKENTKNQERLLLMNKMVTKIYNTEGISRAIIQNQEADKVDSLERQHDSIHSLIDQLKQVYPDREIKIELDSLNKLLILKQENLLELLKLRSQNSSVNYYDRVLNNLKKVNYLFEEDNYDKLFKDHSPHARRALIKWLEYAKEDNAQRLTQQTADSLITSVKKVLSSLEREERRYQTEVIAKENALIKNDQKLSAQLQKIRNEIEREELQQSVQQLQNSQQAISKTTLIIGVLGVACIFTILLFVILISRDTRSSSRYREELEKSKRYAEFLLKRYKQILATVTHDLRSPLNAILGYSDLINQEPLTARQKHQLGQLQKSSDYILQMVNRLLDLSKLEAGKIGLEILPFVPKNLVENCISAAIPAPAKNAVELEISFGEHTELSFLSDPFRIQQVLTNLINNAYKFTHKGKIEVKTRLYPITRKKFNLFIEVSDTGIGIAKSQQAEIFEEFTQANNKIESQYGGSGLGLAITKKIIKLLNGNISLTSEPGVGSVFKIEIPVHLNEDRVKIRKDIKVRNAKEKKILLVDDEPSQLEYLKAMLENSNFKCFTANNGKTAYNLLQNRKFDLVITDIQMPVASGFDLLKKMKTDAILKSIPIIALTGNTQLKEEDYLIKGFSAMLIKPYKSQELLLEIAHVLKLETHQKQSRISTPIKKDKLFTISEIQNFTLGDNHATKNIIKSFLASCQQGVKELNQSVKTKDFQAAGKTAHRLLPMLKQLQASKCVESFELLEKQGLKNPSQLDEENLIKAIEELSLLIKALQNYLNTPH